MDDNEKQIELCRKYNAPFLEIEMKLKVGVSLSVKDGILPINGLRHTPEGNTSGWYIWAGDYSADPDFFVPLHAEHLREWNPEIIKYLGLAPGWRFLHDKNYEDVWKDESLLEM